MLHQEELLKKTLRDIDDKRKKFKKKVQTHKDAYLNLTILARDIRFFLTRTHENADDYHSFITDINNRLALIEDTVNLIEIDSQERLISE